MFSVLLGDLVDESHWRGVLIREVSFLKGSTVLLVCRGEFCSPDGFLSIMGCHFQDLLILVTGDT